MSGIGDRFVPLSLVAVVSALERQATLIEGGMNPAKAMRQVVNELLDYQDAHENQLMRQRSLAPELGKPYRRAA